jgi:hypothetical protein
MPWIALLAPYENMTHPVTRPFLFGNHCQLTHNELMQIKHDPIPAAIKYIPRNGQRDFKKEQMRRVATMTVSPRSNTILPPNREKTRLPTTV